MRVSNTLILCCDNFRHYKDLAGPSGIMGNQLLAEVHIEQPRTRVRLSSTNIVQLVTQSILYLFDVIPRDFASQTNLVVSSSASR